MDLLPADVVNTICMFLGDTFGDRDMSDPEAWYKRALEAAAGPGYEIKPTSWEQLYFGTVSNAPIIVARAVRAHMRQLFALAATCRTLSTAVNWTRIGRVCQYMADRHRLSEHSNSGRFAGGAAGSARNDLVPEDTFSSTFYRVAIVRYLGWRIPPEAHAAMTAVMQRERQRHIRTAKDKMRIDWSKRDKRPTKRVKRE